MTALPDAKREALRFRIWQFCQPREWDVTCNEIAEAVGIPGRHVGSVLKAAGWISRVRAAEHGPETSFRNSGSARIAERFIVRDVLAGRVEAGTL